MKINRIYFLVFIFQILVSYSLFAQIDTLESLSYFPMHIGDSWNYQCIQRPTYFGSDTVSNYTNFTWTIIGDTIMPNSKKYFVFNNNRYIRIDTTSLCVYEYLYDCDYEMLYLYCCVDTEIVFGNVGDGFFNINNLCEGQLFITHTTFMDERYILLKNCGIQVYSLAEGGPSYEMYLINAYVNDQVFNLASQTKSRPEVPSKFQLGDNYPNPFNVSTTIPYIIDQSGNVKIRIFDIQGNLLDVILDKFRSTGEYSIVWNASDVSSGVYIYNIEMDNQRIFKKCLFLK